MSNAPLARIGKKFTVFIGVRRCTMRFTALAGFSVAVRTAACRHSGPSSDHTTTGSMDREAVPFVLVLAMLLVVACADEFVMQLSGELRMYPESMIKARIMRGVISSSPRVNSKGLRYWIQIARDNVVFIPDFGFQTIVPYGQRRTLRLLDKNVEDVGFNKPL